MTDENQAENRLTKLTERLLSGPRNTPGDASTIFKRLIDGEWVVVDDLD